MTRRLIKVVALALAAMLLVTLPGLVGCAKKEVAEREVVE